MGDSRQREAKPYEEDHTSERSAYGGGVTVDAIFYGHNHRGNERFDEWGIPRAYDAGSATLKHSTTALKPRSHIREIDLGAAPETDDIILKPEGA
jgi:hypothetical protein